MLDTRVERSIMSDPEWVTIEALLKKGEYPVVTNLLTLGQDINTAIFTLQKLKCNVDRAVAEHTGLKIEKRINGERRKDEKDN